jgi:hypothetical protein
MPQAQKDFCYNHISLGYMQQWNELVLFIFPRTTTNKCIYFHIVINSFFYFKLFISALASSTMKAFGMPITLEHQQVPV